MALCAFGLWEINWLHDRVHVNVNKSLLAIKESLINLDLPLKCLRPLHLNRLVSQPSKYLHTNKSVFVCLQVQEKCPTSVNVLLDDGGTV